MSLEDYRTLGRSGLVVSPFALGTMTFGTQRWGSDESTSRAVFNGYVGAITNGLLNRTGISEITMHIITSLCIFALEWGLCYFLYKKKIFFKL